MMSRALILPALLVAALALAGCRQLAPVENINNEAFGNLTYGNARPLTLSDYEKAIIRAGTNRNWTFERVTPGHLEGRVIVRGKHEAVVDILFDTEVYSIEYKDSKNLNYDSAENKIHPNYNSWITLLDNDIRKEVQKMQAT